MHEMSIVQSIIDIVQQEMARHQVSKVTVIRLVVGEFTAVVPDSLTFCFELITKDTPLEGVKIELEQVPLTGRCRACGKEFPIVEYRFVCPECQSNEIEAVSGKELFIKEIEAE
jgi:hydrogenase nickel incorporation protein HypA/HybF